MAAPAGIIASVNQDGSKNYEAGGEAPRKRGFLSKICPCFGSPPHHDHNADKVKWDAASPSRGASTPLLPAVTSGKKCLVLDLDETLVHSSFKAIPNADFVVPVEIESVIHNVYVLKRPGVDEFLIKMATMFEIVVFTASLAKYANPLLDLLDTKRVVNHRLFRESCVNFQNNLVKDLGKLGRDLKHTIIIDNSPTSYLLHQSNALPILSWFDDPQDQELMHIMPLLEECYRCDNVTIPLLRYQSEMGDEHRDGE